MVRERTKNAPTPSPTAIISTEEVSAKAPITPSSENEASKTCFWLAQDNAAQRFQKLQTIQTLEKKRE